MTTPPEQGAILAMDLGGTTLSSGLVRPSGSVLAARCVPVGRDGGGDGVVRLLLAAAEDLRREAEHIGESVLGIGLGLPGAIDVRTGVIGEDIQNLPALRGLSIRRMLQERLGLPVAVDNDVNALLLGEWMFGEARGASHAAMLAAGTGVGGALLVHGRLVRGASGYAGEIGHIPVELDGPPCVCGSRGCVKTYAAGPDIADRARELARSGHSPGLLALAEGDPARIDAPLVFTAAAAGDPGALGVVAKAAQALGAAVATLVNLCNPEIIVLGGGVFEAGAVLLDPVRRWAERYAFAAPLRRTRIVRASFSKAGGIRGAAALFRYERGRPPGGGVPPDIRDGQA